MRKWICKWLKLFILNASFFLPASGQHFWWRHTCSHFTPTNQILSDQVCEKGKHRLMACSPPWLFCCLLHSQLWVPWLSIIASPTAGAVPDTCGAQWTNCCENKYMKGLFPCGNWSRLLELYASVISKSLPQVSLLTLTILSIADLNTAVISLGSTSFRVFLSPTERSLVFIDSSQSSSGSSF